MQPSTPPQVDVAVIGSGFGGLSAALRLAEAGRSVAVFEAVNYPGGCAGSYTRRGARFETGATLVVGLRSGELFHRWLATHGVHLDTRPLDPVLVQVVDGRSFPLPASRDGWRDVMAPLVDGHALDRFLALQARVGQPLFRLLQQPEHLPPFSLGALGHHLRHLGDYRDLPRVLGRSLGDVLDRFGLVDPTFRRLVDGLCQITVQLPAEQADATFALGALEVFFAGATHVAGGLGTLAEGLVTALEHAGGQVHYAHRVNRLEATPTGWHIHTTRGVRTARQVVANVLPHSLEALTGRSSAHLDRLRGQVDTSWGAAVLYRELRADALPAHAFHRQLIGPQPTHGHSAWVSVGDHLTAAGHRTLVASTHVPADASPEQVAMVQQRMRDLLMDHAPDLDQATVSEWTASPRTFERFTKRPGGRVGGIPRRSGLGAMAGLWPRPEAPGLWLVGDSVLYGQSTLSTAVSGHRVAEAMLR